MARSVFYQALWGAHGRTSGGPSWRARESGLNIIKLVIGTCGCVGVGLKK